MADEESIRQQFSEIYDAHVERIYRFVFLKVSSREAAEDLTSETFMRCWRHLAQGKEISHISGFLYQTARNLVTDFYRKHRRSQTVSPEDVTLFQSAEDSMERVHREQELDPIRRALSRLNGEYQNVVIWYYLDELEAWEIAEMMDKSEAAVRMQISRALQQLREVMRE